MNRQWRITSAFVVIGLYLMTGLIALRWWMAIDLSLWGERVWSLTNGGKFSSEPILIVLAAAFPSVLICAFNRSRLVHIWVIVVGAYQLYVGIDYTFHGAYFGCDRNGCSAEENFLIGNVASASISVLGAGVIQIFLWIVRAIRGAQPSES